MLFIRHLFAFYEHIHLNPNQSRHLLCFSSRCKDLIRGNPWSKKIDQWLGKYYCVLERISQKEGISEQVSAEVKLGSSTVIRKWLPSFKLGNNASKFMLPQNFYIININSNFPTHHIYPAWKRILIILQNMKGRRVQKFQLFNCFMNWENLKVQPKLIFKNANFQSFPWIGKIEKSS